MLRHRRLITADDLQQVAYTELTAFVQDIDHQEAARVRQRLQDLRAPLVELLVAELFSYMDIFPYRHMYVKSVPGRRPLAPEPLYSRTLSGSVTFSPLPVLSDSIRIRE